MTLTPTGQRQLACSLVASDPQQAFAVARAIEDPWFKCQALAYVGRYWPESDFGRFLREATKAAESQDNWYKRVTVSAWPIRAYLERDCSPPAQKLLERCIKEVTSIENLGGRSEALTMVFQAAKPFDRSLWEPVFWALVKATEPAIAWRQLRNLRLTAAMVASDHPDLLQKGVESLSDEKIVAAIKRDVENHKSAEPRPFFWLEH